MKKSKDISGILKRILNIHENNGAPSLYLNSNRELTLFRCTGLKEYSAEKVMLDTSLNPIEIRGTGLSLKSFSTSEITVLGEIQSVGFKEQSKGESKL